MAREGEACRGRTWPGLSLALDDEMSVVRAAVGWAAVSVVTWRGEVSRAAARRDVT